MGNDKLQQKEVSRTLSSTSQSGIHEVLASLEISCFVCSCVTDFERHGTLGKEGYVVGLPDLEKNC